ncbi:MAG: PqqD family protein [Eubacteriales bacterium]|nr:PqqD family protein [Eubacteriales bacterium]
MRLKKGYRPVRLGNEYVLIAYGREEKSLGGAVRLNEVSAFILGMLKDDKTMEEVTDAMVKRYEISEETASADLTEMINEFKEMGVIE